MRKALGFLRNVWGISFLEKVIIIFRRIINATKYYNYRYRQIIKWGFSSRENTNFTYTLTPANIYYLAKTISVVVGVDYLKILDYINEIETDSVLKQNISEATKKSTLNKEADLEVHFGRRIGWYAFARALKPKIIIETGVDKGLGSVVLCAALLKNKEEGFEGRYYGTDIIHSAGYLLSDKYKEVGEILYGDSIQILSQFEKPIDLFINDSDHSSEYEYQEYLTIKSKISEKAVILGDNAHSTDKLALFSSETNRDFLFFNEVPLHHWYPGAGIGISFIKK